MKRIKWTNNYDTLKEASYKYIKSLGQKEHLLKDEESGKLEVWFSNKNHASYGLSWRNTHLEFAHGY